MPLNSSHCAAFRAFVIFPPHLKFSRLLLLLKVQTPNENADITTACIVHVCPPHSSTKSNYVTNTIAVVSGEPPKEPVFDKTTGDNPPPSTCVKLRQQPLGNVFEKHLLEAYLAEHNIDPITHQPATIDDYVTLQGSHPAHCPIVNPFLLFEVPKIARPRPANLTSLPSLLSVFQSEWDALALETFNLRKQLLETRQELSTALYQHDAACRVIARLEKERNDAREALAKVSVDGIKAPAGESMEIDSPSGSALPDAVASRITQYKEEYATRSQRVCGLIVCRASATRKKRKLPTSYATLDSLRGIHVVSRGQRIHTGFCTVALDPESQYNLALFGPEGALNSIIYDLGTHEWKGQLSDDQGDIQDVEWYNRGPVTAGSNGSISVWSPQGVISFKFDAHVEAVVGVQLHPLGDLLMSAAVNGEWGIHDPAAKITVAKYPPATEGIGTSNSFTGD
jgi:pre-mRNA-processing factor 19